MTPLQTGRHTHTTKDGPHPAQKVPEQDRKGQLTHVPNLLAPKRIRTPLLNDVPSIHRAKKTPRMPHRKSGKDDENTTYKPEGVPTPLSIHKRHSPP